MLVVLSEPLLSEGVRDILALVGFVATIAGLAYAIIQIRKTKSAAEAARQAADVAADESRKAYRRHVGSHSHRFINEAKIHVENQAWNLAAARLSDLADQAAQLSHATPEWKAVGAEIREWESRCLRLASGAKKRFLPEKWTEFLVLVQARVDDVYGPFANAE
jgi:hypothetical protein